MTSPAGKSENKTAQIASFAILFAFACVCAFLHIRRLFFNVFWVDTAFSVDLIRLPIADMLRATSVNEHPPFFYLFGKAVTLILGDHPYAFRSTAFIPYLGILVLALTFIRKNFGYAPAYITVGFSSFTPTSIIYVMETRMYELGCFLALAAFLCMYLIFTGHSGNRKLYWVLLSVTSIMTAYTHYYLTVAVCVMYLSVIVYCLKNKSEIRECLIVSAVAILSYLPWLGVMVRNFGVRSDSWWAQGYSHFDETMREMLGFKRFYVPALILVMVMICIYAMDIVKDPGSPDKKKTARDELFFVISGIAVTGITFLAGAAVSELVRPMFLSRFIYPLSGIAWLLFGSALEKTVCKVFRSNTVRTLTASFSALFLSLFLAYSCFGLYRENVALQASFSAATNDFLSRVSIPRGEVIYSDFEQEEFTIAGCYFPGTSVKIQNAMFYYDIPEEESFYLVWRSSEVPVTVDNLASYGFETTVIASGGTLGTQSDVDVLLCKKY